MSGLADYMLHKDDKQYPETEIGAIQEMVDHEDRMRGSGCYDGEFNRECRKEMEILEKRGKIE